MQSDDLGCAAVRGDESADPAGTPAPTQTAGSLVVEQFETPPKITYRMRRLTPSRFVGVLGQSRIVHRVEGFVADRARSAYRCVPAPTPEGTPLLLHCSVHSEVLQLAKPL